MFIIFCFIRFMIFPFSFLFIRTIYGIIKTDYNDKKPEISGNYFKFRLYVRRGTR